MKNYVILMVVLIGYSFAFSCIGVNRKTLKTTAIQEIEKAENNFSKLSEDSGIHIAFTRFAHENVVIKRNNDTLIKGISALSNYYNNDKLKNVQLTWKPDFIDASESGDLGYTYGKFNYDVTDSTGKHTIYHGVFHTVWQKKENGEWKFVWD